MAVQAHKLKHLDDFAAKLDRAQSVDEVAAALLVQVERLGFEWFAYWLLWPTEGPRSPLYLTNYPAEWTFHYLKEKYADHDAVGRYSLKSLRPFTWSEASRNTPLTPIQRRIFDESEAFGIKAGGSVPLHGPRLAKAALSVAGNMTEIEFNRIFNTHRHEIHLIATYAHEAIVKLAMDKTAAAVINLTLRETEIMTWTARGKTRWEIAAILSISEETVKEHIENACQKLGANNKTHATAVALTHALIKP